ncbi:MAG: beta-propeller fold lactonase family protein, partial [Methylobacterium sp.]
MGRQHLAGWGSVALGLWLASSVPAFAFTAYVTNEKGNSVSVIDASTMAVTATWKVGRRPRGITVSKDGKELFVCASDDDRIDVLDTSNGKVVRSLRSGPDPEQFILDSSGNPLYVANEDDSQVT